MIKRWILPTLLFTGIATAKSSFVLTSALLNNEKSVSVSLKSIGDSTYAVTTGDTISSIASNHHITTNKLKKANQFSRKLAINKSLPVGSKINIPDQTIPLSTLLARFKNAGPMLKEAKKHLGKQYVWAANGPKTFDCSGFTCYVSKKSGISLPRTSIRQGEVGTKINRNELKEGDLVFFDTSKEKKGFINHVGIYIGGGNFIHASSGAKRVVISSLNQSFYKQRFMWGQRINEL